MNATGTFADPSAVVFTELPTIVVPAHDPNTER
jgi:hypothetical protein